MRSFLIILILFATQVGQCESESIEPDATKGIDPLGGMGLNVHFTTPAAGEMEMISQAGFRWIRMDFKWAATEKVAGKYDFSTFDRFLAILDNFHIRAYFILDYGNPLYDGGMAPHTDEGRAAYARWAAAAVHHFRKRGVIWEIWNEPDGGTFWKPKPDANDYAKLAVAASAAIHESDPDEQIVGPALDGALKMDWVAIPAQKGVLDYWSAISIHPYKRQGPESYGPAYEQTREAFKHDLKPDQRVDVFCGESGYCTIWPGMTEELQGKYLPRLFLFDLLSNIPVTIWYDWRDGADGSTDPEDNFGIVHAAYHPGETNVYTPKPAYFAAQTYYKQLHGYQFKERVKRGSEADYILSFTKDTDECFVAWTSSAVSHAVIIPVPKGADGAYQVTSYDGKKQTVIQSDHGYITLTVDGGPQYLKFQAPTN